LRARHLQPYYFGPPERRLFACYHPPRGTPASDLGVLLCYPLGEEYLLAHRAFRRLATLLSRRGFPSLRFDYFGTGDSAGSPEAQTLDGFIEDVVSAVTEMRTSHGCRRIGLVGLRLGATFGLFASGRLRDLSATVLWEPVLSGRAYLDEPEASDAGPPMARRPPPGAADWRYRRQSMPSRLVADLEQLDVGSTSGTPAGEFLLLGYDHDGPTMELSRRLTEAGAACRRELVEGPRFWMQDIHRVLVPQRTLESILRWLSEV